MCRWFDSNLDHHLYVGVTQLVEYDTFANLTRVVGSNPASYTTTKTLNLAGVKISKNSTPGVKEGNIAGSVLRDCRALHILTYATKC